MHSPVLTTVFQPIVDLTTRRPAAYEALTRVQGAGGDAFPFELLEAAQSAGRIAEFDGACWRSAFGSATAAGLTTPHALFVNVEAESLRGGLLEQVASPAPIVLEVTERALLASPGGLLAVIEEARRAGHAIAIDDLGTDPASLALLPLIDPDVIKIDMRIIQGHADTDAARIMSTVNTLTAARDVVVVAEGIETEEHLLTARAIGATHGQGWLLGRPSPVVPAAPSASLLRHVVEPAADEAGAGTPFEIVASVLPSRRSSRDLLLQMSHFLEARARASGDSAILLSTFQQGSNLTPPTAVRYAALAEECALVFAFAAGAPDSLSPAIRVQEIDEDEPLAAEWDVVVLTADFAATLVAREIDPARHAAGLYDFVLTHDRGLAVDVARHLLQRTTRSA
ncbi:EAL domain-containing protein (putative c-di-GMP-specific phosphodiesterase class I) [Rathayibacter sp. PhB93]|uniref:sensor domain-containing phosphodiesterase n=1 Tax=unclassified Rathayibacter TaxID=2609250 RepID=UPI000F4ADF81|nr:MULTISPECIES: EAL domain-containing protein [unclassified Rathayibacter]ROQ05666.1 EAL domain-containing protein (putative c-di-GMP-specific phosphodiesterase class I) [Rathayibacter sp. PhB93]TDQ12264.1 EAL domain-containing protein (putative c-di-GMP-specific phosphodiesterase class I) [Rathayibacter sp. PhB1]